MWPLNPQKKSEPSVTLTPCLEGNKSVLFNLSKFTVTLSKLGEGGIQDLLVFNIEPLNLFKWIISTFGLMVFCFFSLMVIFTYLFGHLVFYLFSPLDSVYLTSSTKIAAKITLFICNNER